MKKKLFIILAIVVVLIVGLLIVVPMVSKKEGNIKVKSDSTTYEYGTKIINSDIEIKKSEYSKTKLTISITNKFDNGIRSIDCYDSDFNPIDSEFDYTYKLGKLVIEGSDIEKISGLTIYFQDSYAKIRYLNTKQYAILYYTWADDAGFILSGGDRDMYYTKDEILEMDQKKLDAIRKLEETFMYFEGEWISEDDGLVNLSFYIDDNENMRIKCYANDFIIGSIELYERSDYEELYVCDDPSWGMMIDFDYYRDTDTLIYSGTSFVRAN